MAIKTALKMQLIALLFLLQRKYRTLFGAAGGIEGLLSIVKSDCRKDLSLQQSITATPDPPCGLNVVPNKGRTSKCS